MEIRISPTPKNSDDPLGRFAVSLPAIPRVTDHITIERVDKDNLVFKSGERAGKERYTVESVEWVHHCSINGTPSKGNSTHVVLKCRMNVTDDSPTIMLIAGNEHYS